MFSKRSISLTLLYNYGIKHYIVNGERIAGLNFHVFTVFRSTVKAFHEYKLLSLIVLHDEHLWQRQHESISDCGMIRLQKLVGPIKCKSKDVAMMN